MLPTSNKLTKFNLVLCTYSQVSISKSPPGPGESSATPSPINDEVRFMIHVKENGCFKNTLKNTYIPKLSFVVKKMSQSCFHWLKVPLR